MKQETELTEAAERLTGMILYDLQTGCLPTLEILDRCAASKPGESFPFLAVCREAAERGEDYDAVLQRELAAFAEKERLSPQLRELLSEMLGRLGSLDYGKQCAVYEQLQVRLAEARKAEKERYRKNGAAAVKIGFLGGLGTGLLLWKP